MRRQWWLLGAGAWSLALLVAAFVVPAYGSASTTHRGIAWAVTILVLCLCLVAMLSVGIFLLPIGILLVVACSRPNPATR